MLFSCLPLAMLFSACRWLCSSLACHWLCSSRFFSSSLQIFVFFSLSSYACCFTSFFSPQAYVGCGSVCDSLSPLALWLWFRLCFFFRVTKWLVTTCYLFLVSGLRESSLLLLVGVLQCHCVMLWIVSTCHNENFSSRPPVSAWSSGSSNTAGWSSILVSLCNVRFL